MVQLYVRVVDKRGAAALPLRRRITLPQAGDVLAVVEDTHEFSLYEKTDPEHLILQLPGVRAARVRAWLNRQFPDDADELRPYRHYRESKIDPALLPAVKRTLYGDGTIRAVPTLEMTEAELAAARVIKPDPDPERL